MKTWNWVLLLVIPFALLIGLNIVSELVSSDVAEFCDHLVIAGVIAYGVVSYFFT